MPTLGIRRNSGICWTQDGSGSWRVDISIGYSFLLQLSFLFSSGTGTASFPAAEFGDSLVHAPPERPGEDGLESHATHEQQTANYTGGPKGRPVCARGWWGGRARNQ